MVYHIIATPTTPKLWTSVDLDDKTNIANAISQMNACIVATSSWLSAAKLKLNSEKTELLLTRPKSRQKPVLDIQLYVGYAVITPSEYIRNLGVHFNSNMSFTEHVNKLCKSAYCMASEKYSQCV